MTNKLVLIDGNSIIYRAFYALPLLNNDKGVYTNAVYGFTTMLLRILEEEKPTHMLVAFDAGKTTFRHKQYEDYKGGRQKTPPELTEQFPLTRQLLEAFNIPHYELELYEADDIIGTLATSGMKEDWSVKVISGDQDLLQLVSDKVTVDLTKKGISEVDSYDPSFLAEKMELKPEQIIDLKALMGDSYDNITGVPGIRNKTATRLLKTYETLDNIYEHIDELKGKMKENLVNYKEDAFMSRELVTINCDSPVTISLEDTTFDKYDDEQIEELFGELGFYSLLERLGLESGRSNETVEALEYKVVHEITDDMLLDESALIVEMLDENYHTASIEGFSIVNKDGMY